MGHYASEMPDYDPPARKEKPPVPLADKKREHAQRTDWLVPLEEGEADEYAFDYDEYTGERYSGPDAMFKPVRHIAHYSNHYLRDPDDQEAEEKFLKHLVDMAKIGMTSGGRPGVIMRRKVTYGPWEVIAEGIEKGEGWY